MAETISRAVTSTDGKGDGVGAGPAGGKGPRRRCRCGDVSSKEVENVMLVEDEVSGAAFGAD